MTKAEQATLETLERGIYNFLGEMKDGINERFDTVDANNIKVEKRLNEHIKEAKKEDQTDWYKVAKVWGALLAPLITAVCTYLAVG